MKLKTTEVDGRLLAEVQDGNPVYVLDDGSEVPYDVPHNSAAIKRLNAEAKARREAYEAEAAKGKAFEGIDPAAARKALEIVGNLDAKRLIDAGEVEKVKGEAKAAFERQFNETYKPVAAERDQLRAQLHNERLSTAFGRSKFIAEKMAVPVDFVQARFGSSFAIEDGKILAKGPDGNPVYSRSKPGEVAEFDEALEIMVDSYPYRDQILKGSGANGGGAGGGRTVNGKRQVTRLQFESLPPGDRAAVAAEAKSGKVDLVD